VLFLTSTFVSFAGNFDSTWKCNVRGCLAWDDHSYQLNLFAMHRKYAAILYVHCFQDKLITKMGFCSVDIFYWFWINRRWRIERDSICCVQSLQIPYSTNTD
jgi:hypothetical protein